MTNADSGAGRLSGLIECARAGDAQAVDALFTDTYRELRKLARERLRGGRRDTLLNTTALVHESYLRLAGAGQLELKDRVHFIAYAGRAMRSVIVDFVRKRRSGRRGGDAGRVTLSTQIAGEIVTSEDEILRVHEALEELARFDPRMVQVVEMRYFAGMTEAETAAALSVTDRTVRREWEKARLWLAEALS